MTFEGEVHTSAITSGSGISVNSADVTFKNYDIDIAADSTLVVDSGKALYLQENSSLNIDGVAADISMIAPLQVSSGRFNVTNGAVASVCLQGVDHNLSINEGSSLNVGSGSTLILTFASTKRSVSKVLGTNAVINVTGNSHIVIRMDESWVNTILSQQPTSGKSIDLMDFGTWNIDDTSSITLEGKFSDSRFGSLTLHSGISDSASIGAGEIGLIRSGTALKIQYMGPLNPYRVLDVFSATAPIGDDAFDSMSGSTGTATIQGKVVIMDSISMGEGAVAKLDGKDASVSYGGITISNREPANDAEIRGGKAGFTIANAVVCVNEDAPAEFTLTAGLKNVLLDNSQSDTKLIAQVGADSLAGIMVSGGEVELVQLENSVAVTLELLVVADGGKVSVAVENALLMGTPGLMEDRVTAGSPASLPASSISIKENGTAQFGSGAELNASLTLESGTHMVFDDVLTMNGCLTLGTGIFLSGERLASIGRMVQGDELLLIEGAGVGLSYAEDLDGNAANMYFSNIDAAFRIMADGSRFGLVMASATPAPEPETGLLSLVALPALAARRRRSLTASPKQASACREHAA